MRRFRSATDDDGEETAVDISPLIDCVFILLIFFIVTTTFVEEKGIEVDKPQAAAASEVEKESVLLAVTSEGKVTYEGVDIGLGGVQPLVRRKLQNDPQTPVIVQAAEDSDSGAMVRVIDEAKLGGAGNVSISTLR